MDLDMDMVGWQVRLFGFWGCPSPKIWGGSGYAGVPYSRSPLAILGTHPPGRLAPTIPHPKMAVSLEGWSFQFTEFVPFCTPCGTVRRNCLGSLTSILGKPAFYYFRSLPLSSVVIRFSVSLDLEQRSVKSSRKAICSCSDAYKSTAICQAIGYLSFCNWKI